MAFVIVLHLDPNRESQLASILRHHTAMPVSEITQGLRIESNHVYVIAPDSYVTVTAGEIRLSEPSEPRGHRYPVDVLFASLANDQKDRAICIVLSGTGHNGTEGLKEVKAQGGCTIVQDPDTAKFDGMPRSAIMADVADQVLAPEKMSDFLYEYVRHGYFSAATAESDSSGAEGLQELEPVLAQLLIQTRNDFRSYKKSTLQRRIHRRMGIHSVDTVEAYAKLVRANQDEATALSRDLMINVTGFFRDPEQRGTVRRAKNNHPDEQIVI